MENNDQESKVFEPKVNEWFVQDDTDEALKIETFIDDKGISKKRCILKDGRVAESRMLKGKDSNMIKRITGNDSNKVQDAVTAMCTTIDGKSVVIEDLENLWFADYTKVNTMAASINFM